MAARILGYESVAILIARNAARAIKIPHDRVHIDDKFTPVAPDSVLAAARQ